MRIALWIASPPTCSVRTPRALVTATSSFFAFFNLVQRSPGGDRPQRFDHAAAHANIPVVEVDGGIAVPGDELQLFAQRGQRPALDPAVLVGSLGIAKSLAPPDARHARVDARGLEACVDDRPIGRT